MARGWISLDINNDQTYGVKIINILIYLRYELHKIQEDKSIGNCHYTWKITWIGELAR